MLPPSTEGGRSSLNLRCYDAVAHFTNFESLDFRRCLGVWGESVRLFLERAGIRSRRAKARRLDKLALAGCDVSAAAVRCLEQHLRMGGMAKGYSSIEGKERLRTRSRTMPGSCLLRTMAGSRPP